MVMKTILYIHGLSSSGASGTARHLQDLLPETRVIAPDLPIDPDEALAMLRDLVATERPDIVIGTSMGGMFAQQLYDCKKIIVNPAFHVSRTMRKQIGICPFLNPRKDGATTCTITSALCDRYEETERRQFDGVTDEAVEKTWALFGAHDTVVNCREEYLQHYRNCTTFDGEHRLRYENIRDVLVPLIISITGNQSESRRVSNIAFFCRSSFSNDAR